MRHAAWLNAVPDAPARQQGATAATDADRLSRRERIAQAGDEIDMPEADGLHLVGYLWEIGPTVPNGMGAAPISHVDIQAWQANTGITLDAWEARLVRELSLTYLAASHQATRAEAPPPWQRRPSAERAPDLARRIRDVLRG